MATHWGWYWKVKLKHKPKRQCSGFATLDSFAMFKNKLGLEACINKVAYEIPRYELKAFLYQDHYFVTFTPGPGLRGSYRIPIEKQPCNYGGFRYFFRCPRCDKRMRILYLKEGRFLCRECLNLGYYTQRLRPSGRILEKCRKIKDFLKSKGGSLDQIPPGMNPKVFKKLKDLHFEYWEIQYVPALTKELLRDYPSKAHLINKLL